MPINSKEISDEITAMEKENASEKPNRKNRKELWKTQSLKDSLYNDDGKGNKIPKASDIDQGSPSKLNYILKQQKINDCFLLTDLMGLARKNPKFITNELIKVKNDNEVEVQLYENKEPKFNVNGKIIKIKIEPSSRKSYSVKKDDAINWKTSHKALWPVVIEIAYAKHLVNYTKQFIDINPDAYIDKLVEYRLMDVIHSFSEKETKSIRDIVKKSIISHLSGSSASEHFLNNASKNLRGVFRKGGSSAMALTHLTGKPSSQVLFQKYDINQLETLFQDKNMDKKTKNQIKSFSGVDTSDVKKFSKSKYSDSVLKIYNKIQKKLNLGKIITVGFKDTNRFDLDIENNAPQKIDNSIIAIQIINLINSLKKSGKDLVLDLEEIFKKEKYEEWLKKNNFTLDNLKEQSYETRKKFVLETADFTSFTNESKISKTQTCIAPKHAYLVLDTLEHEGYKYIVLKNPHQMTTAINYKKSSKLPPEVKLPEQIDKVKNECMMELNHFYKKLASIDYDK